MRKAILALVLLSVLPANAKPPRWLTRGLREAGRAYVNLFTFRHPALALEQWASIGALVFDEKTTLNNFARCTCLVETGPFNHGQRYGLSRATFNIVLAGTLYATAEESAADAERRKGKAWRAMPNALFAAPVTWHVAAGLHNIQIAGKLPAN